MIAPDAVTDVREQCVVRVGLDIGRLRLLPFHVQEAEEALEIPASQDEHACSHHCDDDAADGEVAKHERPPPPDRVEQRHRPRGDPAQPPAAPPTSPALAPERMTPSAPVTPASQPMRRPASSTAAKPMPSASAD